MSTAAFVVLLIVGILAVQVAIWIPVLMWFRRRGRAIAAQLQKEMEAEGIVRGPENGSYRGATVPGYSVVKNNGVIVLTRRRVIFRTLTGKVMEVPVDTITGVRQARRFKGSVVGGQEHLILQTLAGEIAFYVPNSAGWAKTLSTVAPGPQI